MEATGDLNTMETTSVMPSPVAAEMSGAGSFFGSCQVDANNFEAVLEGAVSSLNAIQAEGGDPAKSKVQALLEGLLGVEGAAEYAEFVEILDRGALDSEEGDEMIDLQALSLALQELLAQLEKLLAETPCQNASEKPVAEGELLPWVQGAQDTLPLEQVEQLREVVESLLNSVATELAAPVTEQIALPISGLPSEAQLANEQKNTASEGLLGMERPSDDVLKSALKSSAENGSTESDENESKADASPDPAPTEKSAAVTEVVVRMEGGELKIELVDPKTGNKVATTSTVDMQQRLMEFDVVRQVAEKVRYLASQGGTQRMTLLLNPEHLGQVDLRIEMKSGEMQIHARVDSDMAQKALESHVGLLREGLEKQNIHLDKLEVSVDRQRGELAANDQKQSGGERNQSRRQGSGSDGRLTVTLLRAGSDTGRRLGYNTMEYLA